MSIGQPFVTVCCQDDHVVGDLEHALDDVVAQRPTAPVKQKLVASEPPAATAGEKKHTAIHRHRSLTLCRHREGDA